MRTLFILAALAVAGCAPAGPAPTVQRDGSSPPPRQQPAISLFFRAQPFAHVVELQGPQEAAPESTVLWNVHEWEFR